MVVMLFLIIILFFSNRGNTEGNSTIFFTYIVRK